MKKYGRPVLSGDGQDYLQHLYEEILDAAVYLKALKEERQKTMRWYQEGIKQFAVYPGAGEGGFEEINYLVLGLSSEAGEVAGKWKKFIRDEELDQEKFIYEIGDVLWYVTQLATAAGVSLEGLAQMNYDKLAKRKETNTIQGSGDDRQKSLDLKVA